MDVAHLDGQPLFAALSKRQRALVAAHADEIDVAAGKELIHEGALAWEFFVIVSGSAQVAHGAETIRSLGPGDYFGEIGVLSPGHRRTASVITTSPMTAIVITSHELRAIANEMPDLAAQLRAAIAERSRELVR
jgi:CRP-like cAMP-binding protein